ncbi:MAG: hypothetical protein GXP27_13720 [Planctomycetes bacterium]|nr:hypothetical protein [Planctomycetota bacterium]
MRALVSRRSLVLAPALMLTTFASIGWSSESRPRDVKVARPSPPRIAEEPKTIDPATLVPKKLATAATVEFTEAPLRDVVSWIEQTVKLPVLVDGKALSDEGIALGEPVTDRLQNEPIYLLLNRLRTLGLAWYVEDEVVYLTTVAVAEARMTTETYNVGELLDAGYGPDALKETILVNNGGPLVGRQRRRRRAAVAGRRFICSPCGFGTAGSCGAVGGLAKTRAANVRP